MKFHFESVTESKCGKAMQMVSKIQHFKRSAVKFFMIRFKTLILSATFYVEEIGAPGSSVGRASDSGSRSPGFETLTGHMVVMSDST